MDALQLAMQRRVNVILRSDIELSTFMALCYKHSVIWCDGESALEPRQFAQNPAYIKRDGVLKIYFIKEGSLTYSDLWYNDGEPFEEFSVLINQSTSRRARFKY